MMWEIESSTRRSRVSRSPVPNSRPRANSIAELNVKIVNSTASAFSTDIGSDDEAARY